MPIPQPRQQAPKVLSELDLEYPKALYKKATKGQGDEISPAYPRIIVTDAGQAQRVKDRHPHVTCFANDPGEEAELIKDGWSLTPLAQVN